MEELITETRVKLQNQSAQAQEILKGFYNYARNRGYDEGAHKGYEAAQDEVADWITAEKVRDLWEEQK